MAKSINKSNFDIEDFEEEIVLVHLQTGVYYTIKGAGPVVFRLFQAGLTPEKLYSVVQEKFGEERLQEVTTFISQLVGESILIDSDAEAADATDLGTLVLDAAPVLEKFEDVSDLIKLDPIHDVSDLGWPNKN